MPKKLQEAGTLVTSEKSPWPLVVLGEAGAGKTCGALLLLHHIGRGAYYTAASLVGRVTDAMFGRLRNASSGYAISDVEVWREWDGAHCCVLDELATRTRATDHGYEIIKKAIDYRMGRPLIVISNATSLNDVAQVYDDRISSRLNAGTIVHVTGDQRKGVTV